MLMNFSSDLGIGAGGPEAVCAGLGAAGPAAELVEDVDRISNLLCTDKKGGGEIMGSVFSSEMSMASSGPSSWFSASGKGGTMEPLPYPLILFCGLSSKSTCDLFLGGVSCLSSHGLNGIPTGLNGGATGLV